MFFPCEWIWLEPNQQSHQRHQILSQAYIRMTQHASWSNLLTNQYNVLIQFTCWPVKWLVSTQTQTDCNLSPFLFFSVGLLLASVFSLVTISGDRLLSIAGKSSKRLTPTRAYIVIACIWVLSLAMATPLAFWRTLETRHWKDHVEVSLPLYMRSSTCTCSVQLGH